MCKMIIKRYCQRFLFNIYDLQKQCVCTLRGSYMSAHVLLNLLNDLRKRDRMRGMSSILSLFRNAFYKCNNKGAHIFRLFYHMALN